MVPGVSEYRLNDNCRDRCDWPFLQPALTGKVDFLMRGDQDWLSLAGKFDCPIITADPFIKTLN